MVLDRYEGHLRRSVVRIDEEDVTISQEGGTLHFARELGQEVCAVVLGDPSAPNVPRLSLLYGLATQSATILHSDLPAES